METGEAGGPAAAGPSGQIASKQEMALELFEGLFGWVWLLSTLAAVVLFFMAVASDTPWLYFGIALVVGFVAKGVASGFRDSKARVAIRRAIEE